MCRAADRVQMAPGEDSPCGQVLDIMAGGEGPLGSEPGVGVEHVGEGLSPEARPPPPRAGH